MTEKNLTKDISLYLQNHQEAVACYFFGSRATGDEQSRSDLDIALFLEKENDPYNNYFEITKELSEILKKHGLKGEMDFRPVFVAKERMIPLNRSPLFNFEVIRANRLIYQKDSLMTALLELNILKLYRDFQRIRRIQTGYFENMIKGEDYGYPKK